MSFSLVLLRSAVRWECEWVKILPLSRETRRRSEFRPDVGWARAYGSELVPLPRRHVRVVVRPSMSHGLATIYPWNMKRSYDYSPFAVSEDEEAACVYLFECTHKHTTDSLRVRRSLIRHLLVSAVPARLPQRSRESYCLKH